jgi:zinc finger SWIM domain-containing protein 3
VDISYETARRAKVALLGHTVDVQARQYQQLPAYLEALVQSNPGVHYRLLVDERNHRFRRVFICPKETADCFKFLRGLVATDGAHLKGVFVQTLLVAVGIDANNHIVPLAWAVVESETESSWRWFLRELATAIPNLNTETTTLISDRDKGLQSADNELQHVGRAYCVQHIAANVQTKFGIEPRRMFVNCAYARTKEAWGSAMEILKDTRHSAYMYALGLDPAMWAAPFMTAKTWGHPTSNIVESINSLLLEERKASIIDLLNGIWHKFMDLRFARLQDAQQTMEKFPGQLSTDFALETLKESSMFSQHRSVLRQDNLHGSILSYSNSRYVVDLAERTCTCGWFQVNGIPCGHAVALIYRLHGQPRDFIPTFFSLVTYRDTYSDNVKAIDANISSLLMSEECLPPNLNRPRGRPKEKRLRKGDR